MSAQADLLEGEDERLQTHINEVENIWVQNGGKYKSLAEAQLQIVYQCHKKNRLILACKKELVHSLSWIQELLVVCTLVYVKPHFTLRFPLVFPFFNTTLNVVYLPACPSCISFLFVTPCCHVGHLIRGIYVHWIKFTRIVKEKILPVIPNFTVL